MEKEYSKIWFITGISSGLGKALAARVMEQNDFVIGTFRKEAEVEAFNKENIHKGLALKMDITNKADVEAGLKVIKEQFPGLDVVVNNAGFGFVGAVEEADMEEVRQVFETNVFATLRLTQQILPILRAQRKGHIVQISSHSGFKGMAGFGIYNATKFALEGFSEALAAEIEPLGLKLTIVEPGPFRTGFAAGALRKAQKVIDDYKETAGAFREKMNQVDGKQEGDPQKAALAIIKIVNMEKPPLRLPLGKIAVNTITSKLESVQKDLNNMKNIAIAAVFENQ